MENYHNSDDISQGRLSKGMILGVAPPFLRKKDMAAVGEIF